MTQGSFSRHQSFVLVGPFGLIRAYFSLGPFTFFGPFGRWVEVDKTKIDFNAWCG
jgi:hypothetical protein